MRSLFTLLFFLFLTLINGYTMEYADGRPLNESSDSENLCFKKRNDHSLEPHNFNSDVEETSHPTSVDTSYSTSGEKLKQLGFVSGSRTHSSQSSYQSSPHISTLPSSINLHQEPKIYPYSPSAEQFIHDPISMGQDRYGYLQEIDQDFFPIPSQGWPIRLLEGTRILTAFGIGFLISIPVTSQIMIWVGDWVGANVGSGGAYTLAIYIAATTTVFFANLWDDWFKDTQDLAHPVCVTCISKNEEDVKRALKGKFPTTTKEKGGEHTFKLGFFTLSSMAFSFPPLWQLLWSIEETSFPQLGYVTMPLFYFSMGRIFYVTAKDSLVNIPSGRRAKEYKEILKNSIIKFKNKVKEDPDLRRKVFMKVERKKESQNLTSQRPNLKEDSALIHNNIPIAGSTAEIDDIQSEIRVDEFVFSYLFLVHVQADEFNENISGLYHQYVKEVDIPPHEYKKKQVGSIVDGSLGLGWAALSHLFFTTFKSSLIEFGVGNVHAYWISYSIAMLQSASFVKVTSKVFHTYAETLTSPFIVNEPKRDLDTLQDIIADDENSYGSDTNCCKRITQKTFGVVKKTSNLVWENISSAPSFVTAGLLALPDLKRGIEACNPYGIVTTIIGAGIPYTMTTSFFTNVFGKSTRSLYRKALSCWYTTHKCFMCEYCMCKCCSEAHELETVNMYTDKALDLVNHEFKEKILEDLTYDVLIR